MLWFMKIFVEHHNSQFTAESGGSAGATSQKILSNKSMFKVLNEPETLSHLLSSSWDRVGREHSTHYLLTKKRRKVENEITFRKVLRFFFITLGGLKDQRMTRENMKCTFY